MKELNVFKYNFLPWRFRNWGRNFIQIFRNIKYAWQRATKGYCDYDLWSLDVYYQHLFRDSLRDFTKNLHGAPVEFYNDEEDSIKDWVEYILSAAQHFDNSINGYENPIVYEPNVQYKDGHCILDAGQEEIGRRWFEEECKIEEWKEKELHNGIEMVDTVFFNLWD